MMPNTQLTLEQAIIPSSFVRWCSDCAWRAMLAEVNLSPKPGLVDRFNCGAHTDMALEDFYRSADAIRLWLPRFVEMVPAAPGCRRVRYWPRFVPWEWPAKRQCFAPLPG